MRALRISLIVVGVLLVLAIAADRVALYIAQGEVASRARTTLGLTEEPDVSIKGFPFLTQVLDRHLGHVTLGLDDYQADVDGTSLTIHELDADLRDVTITGGFSGAVAETATGEGLIDYPELSRVYGELLGSSDNGLTVEFSPADDGRLLLTVQASVLGQSMDVGDVEADLVVEHDSVSLHVDEEDIPDTGNPQIQQTINERLNEEHAVSGLPVGLALDSATPEEDGVRITVAGSDVEIG
ncbi:DUF2993 domain-containing protein [Streptomyces hoynatensis]|uniref:DUF2993 domain-containing protein n=1 Tax=Streptomyces hoynatensis TaxID=1141874 RepID=A0A3A9Z0Y7_9ACTN|nr:DUF2993 domain-containing protein [Streptomyces hoynatensis]RKN41800.1 DUF2993 domain-containing protein [Streptomyces hoynatensis]